MNQPTSKLLGKLTNLFRAALPVISLWLLVIALYWRIALAGRVLAGGDVFTYFYPYWAEATRAVRALRLPQWNPYLFMGAPFLANSQVGVFYPLNWPLWLLFPAYRSVHLTIVLHLCLAAFNAYLWGRTSLRMGRAGAWVVGALFALGGYLGAQVEHVNQLQGLAWLPLMLVLWDKSQISQLASQPARGGTWLAGRAASVGLAVVIGLVLLAGHTQTAFISLVGLAAYGLGPSLAQVGWSLRYRKAFFDPQMVWRQGLRLAFARLKFLAVVVGLGVMLAAVQVIPTWELTRLSVRAGGLPFKERVSFSLSPFYAARALLPGFGQPVRPEHIEHVVYVGIVGLALAAVGLYAKARRQSTDQLTNHPTTTLPIYLLTILGLFLPFGAYNPLYWLLARYVPGFAHFRVPGRWLALYALGIAALAGWGVEALCRRRVRVTWRGLVLLAVLIAGMAGWAVVGPRLGEGEHVTWPTLVGWAIGLSLTLGLLLAARRAPRPATVVLLVVLVVELFAAGAALPHSRATAVQAFTSLRPAIAHLLASSPSPEEAEAQARFLSMSDITFDPGDLGEIEAIYGPQLSAEALYDYIVAVKHKEVVGPNLPLAFGVPAVDGYDGGVLPLARYVTLQRLFLPEDDVSIDGRLRENLTVIPDGRWLSLFNVRYVITDKLHDAWLDDVFYDLQFGAWLANGQSAAVAQVPQFECTALGIVAYLQGASALESGALVGAIEVGFDDGSVRTFDLYAGEHVATADAQSKIPDDAARLRWEEPAIPVSVVVWSTVPEGELVVRGVSLIDERTGGFQALLLSDQGRFRLAHSGDVKVYENLDVLPRAFFVHGAVLAEDDEAALAMMQDEGFHPAVTVVFGPPFHLSDAPLWLSSLLTDSSDVVRVTHYAPERVEIEVESASPGYLALTDAWYPGWRATVDGEPVPIWRADILFRAVAVNAGQHSVVFSFRPLSLRVGMGVSLVGVVLLAVWALYKARAGDIMDDRL